MSDSPTRARKFNDEEVALIIKRATELQQTQDVAAEPSTALSLSEVEQIAREAGIDPMLIRQAAHGLDRPSAETSRPSIWVGSPTRLIFERVVDGELAVDDYEPLINGQQERDLFQKVTTPFEQYIEISDRGAALLEGKQDLLLGKPGLLHGFRSLPNKDPGGTVL